MKKYCEATLNVFFKQKNFDNYKKFYLHGNFFVSHRNFTA